jgi:chromosome segregation ATPase
MEAESERATFEKEREAAINEAKAVTKQLETSIAEIASLKEQNAGLEAKLSSTTKALANPANLEMASFSQTEKDLQEAQAKIAALEKKIANNQNDLEYSRTAYQTASSAASELSHENTELRAKIEKLEQKAGENIRQIHEINHQNEVQEYRKLWENLQAIVKDRERELDRAREELRMLKNGRRETRQASVPRSPRLGGIMSPGSRRGVGGGAGSRGTSPAPFDGVTGGGLPSMAPFTHPGNGHRYSHLRDL